MPSDNINATSVATQLPRVPPRTHHQASGPALATQSESIPCPRCDSNNTKFCYYNNYNLSQPRHFCKSCRRYWTHGGTLRNIPVGGGTRKSTSSFSTNSFSSSSSSSSSSSNKRLRCSPATVSYCSSSPALSSHDGVSTNGAQTVGLVGVKGLTAPSHGIGSGVVGGLGIGFSSLLSAPGSHTYLALGGYGPALHGVGFGFDRGAWAFRDASLVEASSYGNFHGPVIGPAGVDSWHVGGGVGGASRDGEGVGLIDGEVFAWPDLAISIPGQGLK